jgi:hypothetical protein
MLKQIEDFIKENINFTNSIQLINQSDKFEVSIKEFFVNNKLKDVDSFGKELGKMEFQKFSKMMKLLDGQVTSEQFIKLQRIYLSIATSNNTDDYQTILEEMIMELNYQNVSAKEKFRFYNSCVTKVSEASLVKIHQHIFGKIDDDSDYESINEDDIKSKSEKLAEEFRIKDEERTLGIKTLIEALNKKNCDFAEIYTELCYDRDAKKFKANSEAVRLIADLDSVQKKIRHDTDTDTDGLEMVEAADMGNLDMIKVLNESGCDIDAREKFDKDGEYPDGYFYYNPLTKSCFKGHVDIVEYLLQQKCSLDKNYYNSDPYYDYRNAMHAACRKPNNEKVIDLLIGAKKNWSNCYYWLDF